MHPCMCVCMSAKNVCACARVRGWPINGPDDFNFVVDRAYAPGRGRRLRCTKEWIAYVDDLTVRAGRVIDGRFFTDAQAEAAVREACAKGAVAAPQSATSALEALGVSPSHAGKRAKHDATRSIGPEPPHCSGLLGAGRVSWEYGRALSLAAGRWTGGFKFVRRSSSVVSSGKPFV